MIVWPTGLRGLLQEGRSQSKVPGYETSDPLYGPAYVRKTTDDTPVMITGSLLFTNNEARAFQKFIRDINGGLDQFEMPIKSEYGVVNQVCQAMPGSFNPQYIGGLWRYNISLVIADWQIPPLAEYEDDFAAIGWNIPESFAIFDVALNQILPGA